MGELRLDNGLVVWVGAGKCLENWPGRGSEDWAGSETVFDVFE